MRSFVALALVILVAPTLAIAARSEDQQHLSVTIVAVDPGAVVAWTPALGPVTYEVYRGTHPGDITLVAKTASTKFFDEDAPPGALYYLVLALLETNASRTGTGDCIASRGTTGYSVTIAHCMPNPDGT